MGLSLDSDFQSGNHAMDLQSIVVDLEKSRKTEQSKQHDDHLAAGLGDPPEGAETWQKVTGGQQSDQ